MKKHLITMVACAAALALAACGSSSSSSGSTSGSTGGSTTGTSTTGTTSSGSGSGGSTGGATVNGCSAATAEDHTSGGAVTITANSNLTYTPACIKVSKGTTVTIQGSTFHPLRGGADCNTDATSPVPSATSNQDVTFSNAGSFGFFCAAHCASADMKGAVFVQ